MWQEGSLLETCLHSLTQNVFHPLFYFCQNYGLLAVYIFHSTVTIPLSFSFATMLPMKPGHSKVENRNKPLCKTDRFKNSFILSGAINVTRDFVFLFFFFHLITTYCYIIFNILIDCCKFYHTTGSPSLHKCVSENSPSHLVSLQPGLNQFFQIFHSISKGVIRLKHSRIFKY